MAMSLRKKEECPVKYLEINAGRTNIEVVTFTGDGKHLLSGTSDVRVWQAQDGKEVAMMEANVIINCLAISKDSKWIAAGTLPSVLMVWDAETRQRVFERRESGAVHCVDFSADSARLVASAGACTAIVMDIPTGVNRIGLDHGSDRVSAAKYSPRGDRIATATENSVRVWDSNDGRLLVHVPVRVTPWRNTGLLWSNDHLFIVSGDRIKILKASTGSLISQWLVPTSNSLSSIALPTHGEFIAYSTDHNVSFWSTSASHSQLAQIDWHRRINSIALSPDDLFLAIVGERGNFVVESLYSVCSNLHYLFQEPEVDINDRIRDLWRRRRMKDAEKLLINIVASSSQNYHALACRALVRAHLRDWDAAIADAEKSIEIQLSGLGCIAKIVALARKGDMDDADRVCDIAIGHFPKHVSFLRLSKAIIMFLSGKHEAALLRADDLITHVPLHSICYAVQAYMYLLIGGSFMKKKDYQQAIRSFGHARARLNNYVGGSLPVITLISGWKFDDLDLLIQRSLCEALYAADRMHEAGRALLDMINIHLLPKDRLASEHFGMLNDIIDASQRLQEMRSGSINERDMDGEWTKWVRGFTQRCVAKLKCSGEAALLANQLVDDPTTHYSNASSFYLSVPQDIHIKRSKVHVKKGLWEEALNDVDQVMKLDSSSSWNYESVLKEWAREKLSDGSWAIALKASCKFNLPIFTVYRALCERLRMDDCAADATKCFCEMKSTMSEQEIPNDGRLWVCDFQCWCYESLNRLGDAAMSSRKPDEAAYNYSLALSLSPDSTPQKAALLEKRCKAYVAKQSWKYVLTDAEEIIQLDPSSLLGFEMKYVALQGVGDHAGMMKAFETMLSKMSESPDPSVHSRWSQCIETKKYIRNAIRDVTQEFPRVLINTTSGSLCDKSEQTKAFESTPLFAELVLSTTTDTDAARIKREVIEFYQYAMFSHTWEENEPLFERVFPIVVYDLDESPTHDKLQMFCKFAREAGFNWAWSDTCCIDKRDHVVLQEAIVAMFRWYRGSALTIVFLHGVRYPAQYGALVGSIWNSRAWTFQEYHASKVVRFYTEDWKLYMDLDIPNHKDAPEIIAEMEEATRISAQTLMTLQPGLDNIRDKLCLVSGRETTRIEDAAYSLVGMFSVTLPVVYGEGQRALGRLLAKLVTNSGKTSILAWTGESGTFNTCLPAHISVFQDLPTTHVPMVIDDTEMDVRLTALQSSSLDPTLVGELFDRLTGLPAAQFTEQRMRLPCFIFKLQSLRTSRDRLEDGFCGHSHALGVVKIQTKQNLFKFDSLYVVHPWISFLLDRPPARNVEETVFEEEEDVDDSAPSIGRHPSSLAGPSDIAPASQSSRRPSFLDRLGRSLSQWATGSFLVPGSDPPPSPEASQEEKYTKALKVIARLRKPFGALLFARGSCNAYKRIAAECLIRVQVAEITPMVLNMLIEAVDIVDVL